MFCEVNQFPVDESPSSTLEVLNTVVKVFRNAAELSFVAPTNCLETIPGPNVTNRCPNAILWSYKLRQSKPTRCFHDVACITELFGQVVVKP